VCRYSFLIATTSNRLNSLNMEAHPRSVNFRRHDIETKKVLVVDDFGDMRSMVKNMLQSAAVTDIDLARNGEEAIEAIGEKRYDIILCDYNLGPGKNGQQVLEEIRHRELIGVGAIFVMITAENTFDMVMGAVEYEPDSYMTKPFTKDLLKARLEKQIARKKDLEDVDAAVGQRDFEKAIKLLDEKIARQPRNIGQLIKLKAELSFRAADYAGAGAIYQQVLAARDMPWARLGLGKVHFASGRFTDAKSAFEELLQQNKRFTAAYDWLARTLQALEAPTEAQIVLEQAVALSPKAILRQQTLGELALKNEDMNAAEKALLQAVKLGRHSVYKAPSTYATLARVKARTSSAEEGRKVLQGMQREFPGDSEAELHAAMAGSVIHQQEGDDIAARADLSRATRLYQHLGDGAAADITLTLARTCGQMGDTDTARELLQQAVRNNHAEEAFLKQVGDVFGELGLDIDPDTFISEIRREIIKLNNEGVELARAGKLQEAVGLFDEAVTRMPNNKVVNLNAARVLIMSMKQQGKQEAMLTRVRGFLNRVKSLDPESQNLRKVQQMFRGLVGDNG